MKTYSKTIIIVMLLSMIAQQSISQVSVNVDGSIPDASAMLDVQSTESGFLTPRMTMAQRDAIASPVTGLLIFQTDNTAGFYYFDGVSWGIIKTGDYAIDDLTDGKTGGSSVFLGTDAGKDDDGTLNRNVAVGDNSFSNNTTGSYNTAMGYQSMRFNTIGGTNTAIGYEANAYNMEGSENTIIGYYAGRRGVLHSKSGNVFLGFRAGYFEEGNNKLYIENSDASSPLIYGEFDNNLLRINGDLDITGTLSGFGIDDLSDAKSDGSSLFIGSGAGANDDGTANENTAVGNNSLTFSTEGYSNTACGLASLFGNSTGYSNTAMGTRAMASNSFGSRNVAVGTNALFVNNNGFENVAIGYSALNNIVGGAHNTAIGHNALLNTTQYFNTACGNGALLSNTTGSTNTAVGYSASSDGTVNVNSTGIGYDSEPWVSNTIRLGNAAVNEIGGYANWTNVSDKRFKVNVQENVAGLDFIMKLRPVTYNLNMDAIARFHNTPDSLRLPQSEQLKEAELQTGFIAQEVEVAANSIGYDFHGVDAPKSEKSHYGLRYAEFVVPLVKATQEQQNVIEDIEKENMAMQEQISGILLRIEKLEKK